MLEVNTEDGFVFVNRDAIDVAKTTDSVKRSNPSAGTAELIEKIAAEEFAKSCIYWPLKIELNHDNAVDFYLTFRHYAVKQINEAKNKIVSEINEQLKNLLAGLNGGSNPAE